MLKHKCVINQDTQYTIALYSISALICGAMLLCCVCVCVCFCFCTDTGFGICDRGGQLIWTTKHWNVEYKTKHFWFSNSLIGCRNLNHAKYILNLWLDLAMQCSKSLATSVYNVMCCGCVHWIRFMQRAPWGRLCFWCAECCVDMLSTAVLFSLVMHIYTCSICVICCAFGASAQALVNCYAASLCSCAHHLIDNADVCCHCCCGKTEHILNAPECCGEHSVEEDVLVRQMCARRTCVAFVYFLSNFCALKFRLYSTRYNVAINNATHLHRSTLDIRSSSSFACISKHLRNMLNSHIQILFTPALFCKPIEDCIYSSRILKWIL